VVFASSTQRRSVRGPDGAQIGAAAFGVGFGVVAALSIGAVVVTGTSVSGMVDGAVLRPLDHPDFVTVPVHLPGWTWAWLCVAALVVVLALRGRGRPDRDHAPSRAAGALAVARIVAGLALLVSVLGSEDAFDVLAHAGSQFALLPLAALVLVPTGVAAPATSTHLGRRLLAACAITESLHAFPVPGSQTSWSVLTAGVAALVVVADGCADVASLLGRQRSSSVALAGAAACVAVVLVVPFGLRGGVTAPGDQFRAWLDAYVHEPRLEARGTGPLRVPSWQQALVTHTIHPVRRECTTFVTLGSDLSWYLLADRRPPTGFNQPSWPTYLDGGEQRANIAALRRSSRPCLLLGPSGGVVRDMHLTVPYYIPHSPLIRYLERQSWVPVSAYGGVVVLRRAERTEG